MLKSALSLNNACLPISTHPQAFKQLQKLPQITQQRIIRKLDFYCQKDPINYADKLTDYLLGSFRFRIGNYRVIFDLLENNTLLILLPINTSHTEIYFSHHRRLHYLL